MDPALTKSELLQRAMMDGGDVGDGSDDDDDVFGDSDMGGGAGMAQGGGDSEGLLSRSYYGGANQLSPPQRAPSVISGSTAAASGR